MTLRGPAALDCHSAHFAVNVSGPFVDGKRRTFSVSLYAARRSLHFSEMSRWSGRLTDYRNLMLAFLIVKLWWGSVLYHYEDTVTRTARTTRQPTTPSTVYEGLCWSAALREYWITPLGYCWRRESFGIVKGRRRKTTQRQTSLTYAKLHLTRTRWQDCSYLIHRERWRSNIRLAVSSSEQHESCCVE